MAASAHIGARARPAGLARPGWLARASGLVRLMRPYSVLWCASSFATMAVLLRGGEVPVARLTGCLVAMSALGAAMRTLNDIADRDNDRLSTEADRTGRPLVTGTVPIRWAALQTALLASGGVALGFVVAPGLGAVLSFGVVVLVLYSAGPAPVARLPMNQVYWIGFWVTVYAGVWLSVGGSFADGLAYLAACSVFMGIGETLAKDLRDLDNDEQAGRLTTPIWIGWRRAAVACAAAYALGGAGFVAAALAAQPANGRLAAGIAIVAFLWLVRVVAAMRTLRAGWSKEEARVLHVGSVRVFLVMNLLLLSGLPLERGG